MKWLDNLRKPAARSGSRCALRLPPGWPETGADVDWILWDAQGERSDGRVTALTQLPAAVQSASLQVWSAAADTLLTRVKLPPASRAKMLQALPFALEEQLSIEPEQLRFAVAAESSVDGMAVAVTAKAQLVAWHKALSEAGLALHSVCPVTLATPWEKGCWTLAWDRHEAWLRTGHVSGWCCSGEWPATRQLVQIALNEARAQQRAPQKLILLQAPAAVDARALEAEFGVPVLVSRNELFSAWSSAAAFDVLNGGARSGDDRLRGVTRAFAPALICLALWVGAVAIADTIEWARLRAVDAAQRADMLTLFRAAFPDAKTVVDPALQMERNLAQLTAARGPGQTSDLLNLLGHAAPGLSEQSKLTALRYDGAQLQIDAEFADQDQVEATRAALVAGGLKVEVVDSSTRDGKISARLRAGAAAKP